MKKIYCAGPLFNPKEREEMSEIAESLESSGYEVFLPQRDGLELVGYSGNLVEQGMAAERADNLLARAIFLIDTFQVADSDGFVLNLNGRVPDEGAMVEAGIAWSLKRPIVIYKDDNRSAFLGKDNPLVLGLSDFKMVQGVQQIPREFDRLFSNGYSRPHLSPDDPLHRTFERGKKLHRIFAQRHMNRAKAERLERIFQE